MRMQRITVLLSACLIALAVSGALQPARAAVVTCPFTSNFTLPSQREYEALVKDTPSRSRYGPRSGYRQHVVAPPARCLQRLGRGVYVMRVKWQTQFQLKSGWPEDQDYSEYPGRWNDARWDSSVTVFLPQDLSIASETWQRRQLSPTLAESAELAFSQQLPLAGSGNGSLALSELCFAEVCNFRREYIGIFGDVGVTAIPAVFTAINICVYMAPAKPEKTVRCRDGGWGGRGYFVHPGTWSMRVIISGAFEFDPLMEYRQ